MSNDPIVRLAKLRIIKASADLEVQLSERNGGGPAIEIMRRLRDRAAESLAALAICDAEDCSAVRTLQNEVKRYDEWVAWLREIISEGIAYDQEMNEAEREDMLDLLTATPEGQQQAVELGLLNLEQRDG